jgi:hypothetical protein
VGGRWNTILETKGINVRRPHQTDPRWGNGGGNEKLTSFFVVKQKGCANINKVEEDLNERHPGGPKPKLRPTQPEAKSSLRAKLKSQGHYL